MINKYLLCFTPVDRYFLGSSFSFHEGFYVESMKYPQQTTILGCLRYIILASKEIYIKKPFNIDDTVKKLTGTSKMECLNEEDEDFGVIKRISPVFLVKRCVDGSSNKIEDILFKLPIDIEMDIEKEKKVKYLTYEKHENAISCYSGVKKDYAICSEKDPKKQVPSFWAGKEFWNSYYKSEELKPLSCDYKEDTIFEKALNVGIARKNRITEDEMYYTKFDYKLQKGFSFGVVVCFDDNDMPEFSETVILGGERSVFRLEKAKIEEDIPEIFVGIHPVAKNIYDNCTNFSSIVNNIEKNCKIIALSPLMLDKWLLDRFEFARIGSIQSISLKSMFGNCKDGTDVNKFRQSEAYCMLPAGSVLYASEKINGYDSEDANYKVLEKIGYNQVIKIDT